MVDPVALASDILAAAVSLAVPAALWGFLFLLAWGPRDFARSIGFGRPAFWLLLPGALLATFALLPFAAIGPDYLAISFGGALFPLIVGVLAVRRAAPPLGRTLGRYLVYLAVESGVLLALVLPVAHPIGLRVADAIGHSVGRVLGHAVALGGAAAYAVTFAPAVVVVPAVAFAIARRSSRPGGSDPGSARSDRAIALLIALSSAVLYLTFLGSSAQAGVGIVEPFPIYLIAPLGAGFAAGYAAAWAFPREEGFALPVAYLAATFGVLVGADVLWQPPLYGSGPAGLYSIGGAGVFDLVYLSGLLALAAAYFIHRANGTPLTPIGPPLAPSPPSPDGRLARAFRDGVRGQLSASIEGSARAGHEAAERARRLLGVGDRAEERPWEGLPVPGWVVADQANLDAVARAGSTDGREGFRSWLTARWLVLVGRELGQRRFPPVRARAVGFAIDLVIVTVPAVLVWLGVAAATPGSLDTLLASVPYNAAIYGFVAFAFLYRVLSEALTGTSWGKRVEGLVVRSRDLERPSLLTSLVRNVSVLPFLTVLGVGGAVAVAVGWKAGAAGNVSVAALAFPGGPLAVVGIVAFLLGGLGLLGAIGVLVVVLTPERQRLGDVLAGTWILRRAIPVFPRAVVPPKEPPTGSGPSG